MTREQELYHRWTQQVRGIPAYAAELAAMYDFEDEIFDRFYCDLSFGTAGLRGVLGMGTNRMNIYTVRRATQGFALYLLEHSPSPTAAIAYDSRILSDVFAREAACVFAANGVKVHLYRELMPTPALSYAVRELGCDAGVVITASHNPSRYNGYKAYGPDGCQIGPETADAVLTNINELDYFDGIRRMEFDEGLENGMIQYIPDAFVERYVDRVFQESLQPGCAIGSDLKIVYTPLNGAGRRCVLRVLERLGVEDITLVPEQALPDGNFPTCPYPNPEMKEALELGLALCRRSGADLLLATDPDADRAAVAVRDGNDLRILTGNEVGVLLLDYIASTRRELGTLPQHPLTVKSIVSSPLADAVAAHYSVEMVSVLTGFKYIGEVIAGLEEKGEADRFIFGFEESCGYLSGGYVRDKDAVNAVLLLAEMAACCKRQQKTLCDTLREIYARHGLYRSLVSSFAFEGADGMRQMAEIMEHLRETPPEAIAGDRVICRTDYGTGVRCTGGTESSTGLPSSNVLEFTLESGSSVIVRPSGTEPKIKLYYSLVGSSEEAVDALAVRYAEACERLIGVR